MPITSPRTRARLTRYSPVFVVAVAFLLGCAASLEAQQAAPSFAGAHALRHGMAVSVLSAVGAETPLPDGRLPSLRASLGFQVSPLVGWSLGVLRLAPENAGLWAGMTGVKMNLLRGRFGVSLFAEGGAGMYQAAVDSGGVDVSLPDGSSEYRPYLRPVSGLAYGGGGGLAADLVLFGGMSLNVTGGYWHMLAEEGVELSGPYVGAGLRFRGADQPWYWRTSGRDQDGPAVTVLAQANDDGAYDVGYGEIRLVVHDLSDVRAVRLGEREVDLYQAPADGWEAPGVGHLVVLRRNDLQLAAGPNTVALELVDGAGNVRVQELRLLGPGEDATGPALAIVSPTAESSVEERVRVRGIVADPSRVATVLVNGVPATLEGTSSAIAQAAGLDVQPHHMIYAFEAEVPVMAGLSTISVEARDTVGNAGTAEVAVLRPDHEAPRFALVEPAGGTQIGAGYATVSGVVVDDGTVTSITVNGVPARVEMILDGEGEGERGIAAVARDMEGQRYRFDANVPLDPGTNALRLVAADASGNEQTSGLEVVRVAGMASAAASPVIQIEEPREWAGAGTRGLQAVVRTSVRVRGTVHDPMAIGIREVRIDGEMAALQGTPGTATAGFTGFVPVDADRREVEVAVWAMDGRYTSQVYRVQAQAAPPGEAWESAGSFRGQRFAVVIGISEYQDDRIRDLEYADDDAQAFYEFLTSPEAGAAGIPAQNIQMLVNEQATYRNLRSALYTFLERATEEDIVYIYIAGHGAPNPRRPDDLYILPYDTEMDNIPGTAFPMSDVNEAIRKLYARHTVLITDACHSGGVSMGGMGGTRAGLDDAAMNAINQSFLMDLQSTHGGLAIFTASEARQVSHEGEQWGGGHGVFTHFLLEGLRGEADTDGDRIVRIGEAMEYTRSMVMRETQSAQIPNIGSQSHDRYLPMAIVTGDGR